MSNHNMSFYSVMSLSHLGMAYIQSSSVGISSAQCLFSPFWCSDSLFQKPSRERRHRDCSGCMLSELHISPNRHNLHNCTGAIKAWKTLIFKHVFDFFFLCVCLLCVKVLSLCSLCFRAIYFAAYSKSKEIFNGLFVPNSGVVHMSSAGVAG